MSRLRWAGFLVLVVVGAHASGLGQAASFRYFRAGNPTDKAGVGTRPGFALMGGGKDLDEAFRWLCDRAGGGDLLVVRATGDDDYNPYIQKLCHLNSVATLLVPDRAAAEDPKVAEIIRHASAVFISGGDQANYINFWMGTPVQEALNDAVRRGVPMGGTSAGLAVMGEYAYTAQGDKPDDPNLDGKLALAEPLGARVTLVRGFLDIPILKGIATDTHFARRNRMGRLLVFLARLSEPDGKPRSPAVRGIGVEERAAVLLEPDGVGRVVGSGGAYFVDPSGAGGRVVKGQPLSFGGYDVQKVTPGHTFNVKTWKGEGVHYTLMVKQGAIVSSQAGGAVY